MPRLREVPRSEVSAPVVEMMYQFLFADRDPVPFVAAIATHASGDDEGQSEIAASSPEECRAFQLAEMATKVEAAHLMMVNAARLKDSGERNDVAAGMAKYMCSEFCADVTQQSFRIHGGYGYSKEYEIERLMRDAPFLLIGEGTSEIQKQIISKRLLDEYRI